MIAGDTIYKYKLKNQIGRGSFGEVWIAEDLTLNKIIALKIIKSNPMELARNFIESINGSKVTHGNLITVHYADVITHHDTQYFLIAMDYLENGCIVSKLNSGNYIQINLALKYVIDILRGLEFLHLNNIIHNDIKPQNIMLGTSQQAVLTDFGISGLIQNGVNTMSTSSYIPHCAPETAINRMIDVKTDVYQAGLTLYRLINGLSVLEPYFRGKTQQEQLNIISSGIFQDNLYFQDFVPKKLRTMLAKSISKDTENRYSSSIEFRRELESLHIVGFWNTDCNGDFIGTLGNYDYSFTQSESNFYSYKTNKQSGRKTNISKYSTMERGKINRIKVQFMQAVVIGNV